jgi:pilus assembly protein CpaB
MRNRNALLISIASGLLAVVMMWVYLSRKESSLIALSSMKDVIVVTQDIGPDTVLDERVLQQIQVPSRYLQPQAASDMREVIGRVTAVPIPSGAQVLGPSLLAVRRTALAYEVPRGQRAVTIAISDVTGVGGLIQPGNFVDVVGTFEYGKPSGEQNGKIQYADERTEVITMMQNMPVLAVNREHLRDRPVPRAPDASQGDQGGTASQSFSNVTLLVSPSQVQELILAQHVGTLTLTLRSAGDTGETANLSRLDPFGLLKVQIPLKPRAVPVWREIRGYGGY